MKTNHLFPHRFKWIGWCLFVPFALLFFVAPIFSETFDDNLISFPTLSIGVKALNGFRLEGNEMGFTAAFERQDMFHEICIIAMSVALLFIAFAREKDEDEYVEHLRLHSFVCHSILAHLAISHLHCEISMGIASVQKGGRR